MLLSLRVLRLSWSVVEGMCQAWGRVCAPVPAVGTDPNLQLLSGTAQADLGLEFKWCGQDGAILTAGN